MKKESRKSVLKRRNNHGKKDNPSGSKIIKRASRHNLDGTKQFSLITMTLNEMRKDKREITQLN